jgi:hypothetical protein
MAKNQRIILVNNNLARLGTAQPSGDFQKHAGAIS